MGSFYSIRDLITETLQGKSIYRILSNWEVRAHCKGLGGTMIDLGGGEHASYERYWDITAGTCIRTDVDASKHPDMIVDLNEALPFGNFYADHIFLFDVLYILADQKRLFGEIYRVLKPGGILWIISPLLFPEAREPSDLLRYTSQGLENVIRTSGFSRHSLRGFGERGTAAAFLLSPFCIFRFLRIPLFICGMIADRLVPAKLRRQHPAPLGYFCRAIK